MAKVLITEDYLSDIGDAIRGKLNVSSRYTPGQMASAICSIPVVSPTIISKTILSNGTYNASEDEADGYNSVSVDVPNSYVAEDEGKVVASGALSIQGALSVYSNSIYDTTLFSQVNVDVSQPVLVSKTITENGSYDPADDNADAYSGVVVNVSGGGGGGKYDNFLIAIGAKSGSIYDSVASILGSYAFYNNQNINGIEMKAVSQIKSRALAECSNISTASFENCELIGNEAFSRCTSLKDVFFPVCSRILSSAFMWCSTLSSVSFPECSTIGSYAFARCSNLKEANFRNCKEVSAFAFVSCSKLEKFYCEENIRLFTSAFCSCSKLSKVILLNSSVCTLDTSYAFIYTPLYSSGYLGYFGSIFVPASLTEEYKSATNWSFYSDRITSYVEE